MSVTQPQYAKEIISEQFPAGLEHTGKVSVSTAIAKRRKVYYQPNAGSITYAPNGSSEINIAINSVSEYVDLKSAELSFFAEVEVATQDDGAVFSDLAGTSVFQRYECYLGGVLVDSVDNVNIASAMKASVLPYDYYNSVGSIMGGYKYNPALYGAGQVAVAASAAVPANNTMLKNQTTARVDGALAITNQKAALRKMVVTVPMSMFGGLFESYDKMLPLRNCGGSLLIKLILAQPSDVLRFTASSLASKYKISQVRLGVDMLMVNSMIVSIIDAMTSQAGAALRMLYKTPKVFSATVTAGSGQKSIVCSQALGNVCQVQVAFQKAAPTANVDPVMRFENNELKTARLQIGSDFYPSSDYPALPTQLFALALDCWERAPSVSPFGCLMDYENFNNGKVWNGSEHVAIQTSNVAADADAQLCVIGFNLERNRYISEIVYDGLNTSGSNLVLQIQNNTADLQNCYFVSYAANVITLANGMVKVAQEIV